MAAPFDLTAGWIADVTGGRFAAGAADAVAAGVSIDTRTLHTGAMYVALRGERLDGHDFVRAALDAGASGVLVSDEGAAADPGGAFVIVVDDTLAALQTLGREIRRRSAAIVVAITGSAGKTTTKELTAALLETKFDVFRNRGNFNNHIGLPLSLTELRSGPDVAVVELGMSHKGEISTLVGLAEPEVRVWTNVGNAHIGFFNSRDEIADAKAEILERARATDLLVANADDEAVMARATTFQGRVVTFGLSESAGVRAIDVETRGIDGTSATIVTPVATFDVTLPLVGRGNLMNALAAVAVAIELDVPIADIVARIGTFTPAPKRGEVIRLSNGVTVVDDSYNSSPAALLMSLDALASTTAERRAAVLGEMLELGDHAQALHEECGRAAAASNLGWLVTVGGGPARAMADAAVDAGMAATRVTHVPTADEAAGAAVSRARRGDVVLVKGSRGIGVDRVVARLKEEAA